jgi:recombination protein RecT
MSNKPTLPAKKLFSQEGVTKRFQELLGKKAPGFISNVLQIVNQNKLLAKADPQTVLNAAATAATLDLPINQSLGRAWIVPYKGQAQFQIGYKGFIELAQRTGQYKAITAITVYENQFEGFNSLTEELQGDFSKQGEGDKIGYAAYFRLLNGFEKTVFWTMEEVQKHGKRFSKAFTSGPWKTDFDAMAKKTVLKHALSNWGPLSIEMQTAMIADQSIQKAEGEYVYDDNPGVLDISNAKQRDERQRLQEYIETASAEQLDKVEDAIREHGLEDEADNRRLELQNDAGNE